LGAARAWQIPPRGWWQILRRGWKQAQDDNIPLIGAGVAFYAFLAIFPALIAAMLLYGLLADPSQVSNQVKKIGSALPDSAQSLLGEQMSSLTQSSRQGLGLGLIIAVALSLWSASGGMSNLVTAVNIAYAVDDDRNMVKRRALSLLLTLGAIVFVVAAVGLIAVLPAILKATGMPTGLQSLIGLVRWLGLIGAMLCALAVLYRAAPARHSPTLGWTSTGAVAATALWIVASLGFSVYVNNFGSYGKTYGSLAGVVVLMLWLWISNLLILLGAVINGQAEQQAAHGTT